MALSGLPHLMFPKVSWAEGRKWAGYRSGGGSGTLHLGGIAKAAGGWSYSVPTLVAQRQYGNTVQATVIISLCFSGDVERPCFFQMMAIGSDDNRNSKTVWAKTNSLQARLSQRPLTG